MAPRHPEPRSKRGKGGEGEREEGRPQEEAGDAPGRPPTVPNAAARQGVAPESAGGMTKTMGKAVVMVGILGAAAVARAQSGTWADKVTVKGDLRYRYELIDDDSKSDTRQRDRIRLRVGVEAKANDHIKVVAQLATGSEDAKTSKEEPQSSNQTLGEAFGGKDIFVDLAYVDWSLLPDQLKVLAGKMKNPFITVGDLIWDSDVNPEGLALNGSVEAGPVSLFANAGAFWLYEYAPSAKGKPKAAKDIKLYGAQLAGKIRLAETVYLQLGGSYYAYDSLKDASVADLDWKGIADDPSKQNAYGNSTRRVVDGSKTNLVYANDYTLAEGFAELGIWVGIPITLFGQYVVNTDADEFDTGFLAGVGIGKAKNPKTWELNYAYGELEKDAVYGQLTDSDRWDGGTDGRGHKIQAKYQLFRNWQLSATYFMNEKKISDASHTYDYNRLQLDLVAAF